MESDTDNLNDGSPNGGPSSSDPAPPAPPKTIQERIEQARDLAIDLYCECGGMVNYVGVVADHYLKLIHAYEVTDELDVERGWLVLDIAWSLAQKMKRLRLQLERADVLIEPFSQDYDGVSVGPLTIGHITGSSAHATAVLLGRYFYPFFQSNGPKIMPLEGEGKHKLDELSLEQLVNLLPKWRASAQRMQHEILNVVGLDYEQDYQKWCALTRVEAGRMLVSAPADPPRLSPDEERVLDVLKKANKRLRQWALLDAMGVNPDDGSWKKLLGVMRKRGTINNNGSGYGLPEWKF